MQIRVINRPWKKRHDTPWVEGEVYVMEDKNDIVIQSQARSLEGKETILTKAVSKQASPDSTQVAVRDAIDAVVVAVKKFLHENNRT